MTDDVKSSVKSKMKKRPPDWEAMKNEIAAELGLWDKVKEQGWAGLTAEESGRVGGIFSKRKLQQQQQNEDKEE